ncbi:FxSxx-COOH cyclophane-containing RiPP peptide [Streptomyces corynorhini]|uniref:FXSXX-COOH protein n=1 Tax=Streptomyces corynorhini TaxID=2282652 RepID=A0A370BCA7_9ACTN|nr:FXSXX-COOH protein [Streptomyces corynorhini]
MDDSTRNGGTTRHGWQDTARGPHGADHADHDQDHRDRQDRPGTAPLGPPPAPPLPDLLALDLAALRTLDHPVLTEILTDLRARSEQPKETLWGFTNAF